MVSVTWDLEWDLAIMFNEAYRFLCLGISRQKVKVYMEASPMVVGQFGCSLVDEAASTP
jgi:hypothetical protein